MNPPHSIDLYIHGAEKYQQKTVLDHLSFRYRLFAKPAINLNLYLLYRTKNYSNKRIVTTMAKGHSLVRQYLDTQEPRGGNDIVLTPLICVSKDKKEQLPRPAGSLPIDNLKIHVLQSHPRLARLRLID